MDEAIKNIAVSAKNIYKTFKTGDSSIEALKDINFDIKIGELIMIVGPSGCGKTTLLSIIAGTLNADRGSMFVFGSPLHDMKQEAVTEFRKKNIGFIFQQYHLIKTLSCLENVSIPLLLNHYPKKEAEERAAQVLEQVGLQGREFSSPKILSGGQQQRVAIARALVHKPALVICDEPTAALDAETGSAVIELMRSLVKTSGETIIIVTHDSRIFKFADRILKMDDGKMTNPQCLNENIKNSKEAR